MIGGSSLRSAIAAGEVVKASRSCGQYVSVMTEARKEKTEQYNKKQLSLQSNRHGGTELSPSYHCKRSLFVLTDFGAKVFALRASVMVPSDVKESLHGTEFKRLSLQGILMFVP